MGRVRLLTLTLISHASVGVSRRETKFCLVCFSFIQSVPSVSNSSKSGLGFLRVEMDAMVDERVRDGLADLGCSSRER